MTDLRQQMIKEAREKQKRFHEEQVKDFKDHIKILKLKVLSEPDFFVLQKLSPSPKGEL